MRFEIPYRFLFHHEMIPLHIIVCNLYILDETKVFKERQVRFAKLLVKLDQKINNAPAALDNELLPMIDSDERNEGFRG